MIFVEQKLIELGLALPSISAPKGTYLGAKRCGSQLFVSGQLPILADGRLVQGLCGENIETDDAYEAAKLCALHVMAQVKHSLNGFEHVIGLVKATGFVAATPTFTEHPKVMNGASDLFVALLGDRGLHSRAAVGVSSLPLGAVVEVEALFEIGLD